VPRTSCTNGEKKEDEGERSDGIDRVRKKKDPLATLPKELGEKEKKSTLQHFALGREKEGNPTEPVYKGATLFPERGKEAPEKS